MDWLSYRVVYVEPDGVQSHKAWQLRKGEETIALFASSFGAEAEGRRLAHLACLDGTNARLIVYRIDGSIDAEFTFSAPPCEGEEST